MGAFENPIKSVACGDMHSVAMTYDEKVYVWGECNVDQWHPGSQILEGKVDITALLEGGVPLDVGAAGTHTCVIVT